MGDNYQELVKFIETSDVKDDAVIKFVDVIEDDMARYDYVSELLNKGYRLPLTVIND
jgi:hypothetical protein